MKTKEFDSLIRSKFDENDFEFNPDNWAKMEWKLDDSQKNKGKSLWFTLAIGLAASFTLLAAVGFYRHFSGTVDVSAPVLAANENADVNNKNIPVPPSTDNFSKPVIATGSQVINTAKPLSAAVSAPAKMPVDKVQAVVAAQEKPPVVKEDFNIAGGNGKNTPSAKSPNFAQPLQFSSDDKAGKKIRFSVGGGFNYGASGAGYMLSATASRNLGGKFYIEGDLALVNNSATNVTKTVNTSYSYQEQPPYTPSSGDNSPPGVTTSGPVVNIKQEEIISQNALNLYYMQFTPVFGYALAKKIKVGMGADFQQLLQDRYKYVSDERGNLQNIPGMDFGIVGKLDLSFSKRIKTTLSYREGITNAVKTDKNYLDRDYLQVQFKYNISK